MVARKITLCSILLLGLGLGMSFFSKREVSITLSYTLNYQGDNWSKNRTGLLWALSYLGAELPKGSFDKSIEWIDSSTFKIRFHELGFSEQALQALGAITDSIQQSAQYRKMKSLDLGQFIALTVGSSWHYYAITGMPANYRDFLQVHRFNETHRFPLVHSTVAIHNRLITASLGDSPLHTVFVAEEGLGDLSDSLFKTSFYEVMDVMPNGQLRFAIYDAMGHLTAASPTMLGEAGKPAKCIWCHEVNIQPLFRRTDSLVGRMSPHEFQNLVGAQNKLLNTYRAALNSDIDFTRKQDHTLMELAYISYMEPSIKRLSQEWHISERKLRRILRRETKHTHHEFDFLNELYTRQEVNAHAPCQWIDGPGDIREPSKSEPDFIR